MAVIIISDAQKSGDLVTLTGTVDGVATTATVWASHLVSLPTVAARKQACAQALQASLPAAPVSQSSLLGTVTL